MIATTIEQSKRLLEAGIDPQTADMYWTNIVETTDAGGYFTKESDDVFHLEIGYDLYSDHVVPAWSLSAIIKLIYSIPTNQHKFEYIVWENEDNVEGVFEDLVEFLCKKK